VLPAVLAATGAAAAAAVLLVSLASAASGDRKGVCASCLLVVHAGQGCGVALGVS
jgi:hypothetical protein